MWLIACAAQLVGSMLGWCWGRRRTFLENGPVAPYCGAPGAIWRATGVEPALCSHGWRAAETYAHWPELFGLGVT